MKEAASTNNLSSTERDELLQRVKELEDEIAGLGQRVAELETVRLPSAPRFLVRT